MGHWPQTSQHVSIFISFTHHKALQLVRLIKKKLPGLLLSLGLQWPVSTDCFPAIFAIRHRTSGKKSKWAKLVYVHLVYKLCHCFYHTSFGERQYFVENLCTVFKAITNVFFPVPQRRFISLLSICVIFPLNNNRLEDDKILLPSSYLPFPTRLDVFHPPIPLVRHIHYSLAPVVSDSPVLCSRILVIYLVQWYLPAPKRSAASPPVKHPRNIATKEKNT